MDKGYIKCMAALVVQSAQAETISEKGAGISENGAGIPGKKEAAPRLELGMEVLQTSALPLGHAAWMS